LAAKIVLSVCSAYFGQADGADAFNNSVGSAAVGLLGSGGVVVGDEVDGRRLPDVSWRSFGVLSDDDELDPPWKRSGASIGHRPNNEETIRDIRPKAAC
jgi:hypothetical protein